MHELSKDTVLWTRLSIFIYDLRKFSPNPQSAERLNLNISPDYMSEPYFDKSRQAAYEILPLREETLQLKKSFGNGFRTEKARTRRLAIMEYV
jgi:hypothetical protein